LIRQVTVAIMVRLIRFYQIGISPLIGPTCRFTPTCSQYAIESIEKHGPCRGIIRAVWRIMKCHPFHPGGYDPP
jgi:putative membrane protein insertion efficiency factor